MSEPSAPTPPSLAVPKQGGKRKRRGVLIAVLVVVLLVLGAGGAGAAVQLKRELPVATLATSVAATLRIPGGLPRLPWPSTGSAELMIEGMGRIGGSGGGKPAAVGSVAKVMTAYLILKNHPLGDGGDGPDITITAADVADYNRRVPLGQAVVSVKLGEKLSERDALVALLLPSANNIARTLAVWDAGSEAAFLERMNDAAGDLGMTDSHYTDPSGFLPTTTSTAADQVILARAALKDPVFAAIVAMPSSTIPVAGKVKNHNALLGELGVYGIKTGSTGEAGGNLVFAAQVRTGGRTLTLVGAVFNQPGGSTPQQQAAVNKVVRRLLKAVRTVVKEYPILPVKPVGTVTTAWGSSVTVSPVAALKVVGWPGLTVPVKVTKIRPGAQVARGTSVGQVQASNVRVDLTTDAATAEPTVWWKLKRKP